jgi:Nitronate monooxygenase
MHLDFLRIRYYVVRGYEPHCLGTSEVAASRAQVVEIFYGDPDAVLVRTVHDSGALASWQVSSAAEAWAAVEAGCDFVVAQGTEAGRHVRGRLGLLALLPEVLGAVEVPVLAAGGVGTARGWPQRWPRAPTGCGSAPGSWPRPSRALTLSTWPPSSKPAARTRCSLRRSGCSGLAPPPGAAFLCGGGPGVRWGHRW